MSVFPTRVGMDRMFTSAPMFGDTYSPHAWGWTTPCADEGVGMKYSKELHDKLRNRTGLHIFNHQIGLDSEDIDALLDEIERLKNENKQYQSIFDLQKATIELLQVERRWIPVSERLPEYGEPSLTIYHTKNATSQITIRCLVEDRDDELRVIWYDIENGLWVNENNITHWMPLPEPPEEK